MIGGREPRWVFTHLNKHDEPLGELAGVRGGGIKIQPLTVLGTSGDMILDDLGQDINFLTDRVRCEYDPGTGERWAFGTFMMRTSKKQHYDTHASYDVQLISKLQTLVEKELDLGYTIPAGKNIVEAIVELIEGAGESRIAATESNAVLANPLTFTDETVLEAVNKLAEAANFWAPWVDGLGQFRVEPYSDPADRAIVYEFVEGAAAVHFPEWGREQDLASVPNVVKVRRLGSDSEPGLQGVAVNSDPESPFSTVSRGFEVTRSYEAEAADQATLNNLAKRYLLLNQSPVAKIEVTHAVLPLEQNQRVRFVDKGYDRTATIRNMSFTFDDFTHCKAEWIEVA